MNSDQWQRVETLYQQALECESNQDRRFLLEHCSDAQVRVEVATLPQV